MLPGQVFFYLFRTLVLQALAHLCLGLLEFLALLLFWHRKLGEVLFDGILTGLVLVLQSLRSLILKRSERHIIRLLRDLESTGLKMRLQLGEIAGPVLNIAKLANNRHEAV